MNNNGGLISSQSQYELEEFATLQYNTVIVSTV